MRVLDLFCGAGGASMGYHLAGFDVVGVDIKPQPRYPFEFIQADVLWFGDLVNYDLIHASPPCQAFTKANQIHKRRHQDLIEETRHILQRSEIPYVIENVPGAPLENPIMLCGSMFGLRTYRHRLFETSFPVEQPHHPQHYHRQAKMGRPVQSSEYMQVVGNFSNVALAREIMQIDWMTRDELKQAIPPAYTRWIAQQWTT